MFTASENYLKKGINHHHHCYTNSYNTGVTLLTVQNQPNQLCSAVSSSHTIGYANIQLSNTNSSFLINFVWLGLPRGLLKCFVARTKKAFNVGLHDIVIGCCIKPNALECISKESRYSNPLRSSRNSHVRPWVNCVDQ